MDVKKSKEIMRKHKKPRPPSSSESSSSSDSDSESSSDSFSSSSSSKKPIKRKTKRIRTNRRSTSSSDDERARKREKHACHKKLEAKKSHLKRKLKEAKAKKRIRSLSPAQKLKKIAMSAEKLKHHGLTVKERLREKEREQREREREREQREREKDREREKEREKLRIRERERIRSRSPKALKSRSPKLLRGRDPKRKSPILDKHHVLSPREKLICQIRRDRSPVDRKKEIRRRHEDSREREKRERERAEREAARNKEREEALARCQERQRERERLAREKLRREKEKEYKSDRLLPRPAEREMAIAAARASSRERSLERDPHRSHLHAHSRPPREPVYERGYDTTYNIQHEHRIEKEDRRDHDREYLVLRRREVESPPPVVPPIYASERVRTERELYPEEQKYEREHAYLPRSYISPSGDTHRREANWEREHEIPRERELDHGKLYPPERPPPATSRDWAPVEEDWRISQKDHQWGEENWQRNEAPTENWDGGEKNFRPHQKHEWDDSRIKHDTHREVQHPPNQPTHVAKRWPQEWRGRQAEDRPPPPAHQGQLPANFHHNPPAVHPIEYPHERPEPIYPAPARRQHPLPKPLMQQHVPHPGTYHVRPHFPSKRQMTYINPNVAANQNLSHISKVNITTITSTHTIPVAPQNHLAVNQPAAIKNTSTIEKPTVEGLQDKTKEKLQEQQSESRDLVGIGGGQQPIEEPIPDDLSEISDDADEILNKDEEVNKIDNNEENWDSDSNGIPETDLKKDEEICVTASNEVSEKKFDISSVVDISAAVEEKVIAENKEQPSAVSTVSLEETVKLDQETGKEIMNDDVLDFEEISDGELEEESRTKNLGDALGVDWASLVEESSKFRQHPIEKHTTTKQKWQPHRVILDVGISLKYAGEEFAKRLIDEATLKLDEEEAAYKNATEKNKMEIKLEDGAAAIKNATTSTNDDDDDINMKLPMSCAQIKIETKENIVDNELKSDGDASATLSAIACIQVAQYKSQQRQSKKSIVFNACRSNSRALSARKDLKLRRQLCELPVKEVGYIGISNHLKSLALKAFEKTLTEVK